MATSVIDALRHDFAYAVRTIVRAPGFTAMVVTTMTLGVGANAALFSTLDRIFGQAPAGVSEAGELRRLYVAPPASAEGAPPASPTFNYPSFAAIREAVGGAGRVAAWMPSAAVTVRLGEAEMPARVSWVSHDFFEILGVAPALGRLFGADEERIDVPAPVAVVSHAFWERAAGLDPELLGRTLVAGGVPATVVGVGAEGFSGLDLSLADVFLPLSASTASGLSPGQPWYESGGNYLRLVARLHPGTQDGAVAAGATVAYQRQPPIPFYSFDDSATIATGSIIEARGPGALDAMVSVSIRIAGVTALVLLIACANVASLLLLRATRTRRELAVRLALGAPRRKLVSQLLVQSLVLSALAGAAALLVAGWGGEALRRLLLPTIQWAQPALELRTVAFTLGTAVAVGLLAGIAPALQTPRTEVTAALRAGAREGDARGSRARALLVMAQTALAMVLLIGAGLFVRSVTNVEGLRLGYDADRLLVARVGGERTPEQAAAMAEVAARVSEMPSVSAVALSSVAPMTAVSFRSIYLPGGAPLPQFSPFTAPSVTYASPEFFAATGMRIVAGRPFEPSDGRNVVVVNEAMARALWPGESALGRCLVPDDPEGPCAVVVGIAEDARRMRVMENEPGLQYFLPLERDPRPAALLIRIDPRGSRQLLREVRAELESRFGPEAVRVQLLADFLSPELRPWRLGAQLFTLFGVLALLVTIVGIYSVTAYSVGQRTHEMGVRIALGARLDDVLALILAGAVRVTALGIVLGVGVALALGRLVESLLFGITPSDPVAVATAAAVLLAAGAVAALVPAWRAARVDPVRALAVE